MGDRIERMLAAVDWAAVVCEQGSVVEFPERVRGLWGPREVYREAAVWYLGDTGFASHACSEATVAMMPVVVAVLADSRLDGLAYTTWIIDDRVPVRAAVLEAVGRAADHAAWGGSDEELRRKAALLAAGREDELIRRDPDGSERPGAFADVFAAEQAPHLLWMRTYAGDLLDACLPWLDDPDPRVAQAALYPVARSALLALAPARRAAEQRLLALAATTPAQQTVQGTAILELITLGVDTTVLLDHPSPALRAIAALAPSTADDPRSLPALQYALQAVPDCDAWLDPTPLTLVRRLVIEFTDVAASRARTFDDLLPGALTAATDGRAWRSLLPLAFPPGWPDQPITQAQREFLQRVVDNDGAWHPAYTDLTTVLTGAGLPPDRDSCRNLVTRLSDDAGAHHHTT